MSYVGSIIRVRCRHGEASARVLRIRYLHRNLLCEVDLQFLDPEMAYHYHEDDLWQDAEGVLHEGPATHRTIYGAALARCRLPDHSKKPRA